MTPAWISTLRPPTLRLARPGDGAPCYDVMYRAVHQGAVAAYSPVERQAWMPHPTAPKGFQDRILAQHTVVACKRGVIGFMTLGHDGHLDLAYVAPDWMGRGVGDRLYTALLDHAVAHGLSPLSTEASLLFRPFLARRGWTTQARQSVIRNGVAITNFRMQLTGHV
ncbi:GNAT family N-acetyltransferase [Actibacterium ureilyticum]|uniref:GNAT family N-acetyltransferase n=1 Tax=Actibacterium ureilyticum TaxID=1590614 RepID=UPI001595EEF3|nr:GNAT family N-acetyltransferase [Actibacterium ureilyticum]